MNSSLFEGTVVGGKFVLARQLATGGQGSVWTARDRELDVEVAIKFLGGFSDDPELVERFHREARAAAQIRSPHVVQVYEHGTFETTPHIVMELLKGEDLQRRLRRVGRLDAPATAAILRGACKALRRAHAAGLVHRDLKPGNLFLVQEDGEEIVKVVDFGAAKLHPEGEGRLTKTGFFMGTPQFMAPEQIRSFKDADHRADLWSMGVIAYRALTGELPFRGPNLSQVLKKVCEEPLSPATSIVPSLGPAVDAFFERALAKDREARFQSADELADAFEKLAAGVPASGPVASPAVTPGALPAVTPGALPAITPAPAPAAATAPESAVATSVFLLGPAASPRADAAAPANTPAGAAAAMTPPPARNARFGTGTLPMADPGTPNASTGAHSAATMPSARPPPPPAAGPGNSAYPPAMAGNSAYPPAMPPPPDAMATEQEGEGALEESGPDRATVVTRVILVLSLLFIGVAIIMILKGAGFLPG